MKTFNKRGDKGETSLLYGGRIPKDSLRVETYGKIDEVVSALGLARNFAQKEKTRQIVLQVQKELFTLGAELASDSGSYKEFADHFTPVTEDMVDALECQIDELEAIFEMPKSFIIPGGNTASASLDLSRSMVRTTERRAVALTRQGDLKNPFVLSYLNRLADLLFTLARYEES